MNTEQTAVAVRKLFGLLSHVHSGCWDVGLQVAPVTEVLLSAQGRYHDLLAAQLQKQLIAAVDTDVLAELEIRTESQHNTLTLEYGLPWQLEGAGMQCTVTSACC